MSDTSKDSQRQNSTRLRGKSQDSRRRKELTKQQALEDKVLGRVMGEQPRLNPREAGQRRELIKQQALEDEVLGRVMGELPRMGAPSFLNEFDPTSGGRRPLNPDTEMPFSYVTPDPLLQSIMRRLGGR
jgi:hypothetical protein